MWGMPAGGLLEGLEVFPRLGPDGTGTTGGGEERPASDFSPSDFLSFSPQCNFSSVLEDFHGCQVDLLGSSSWREAGDFFSQNLGFLVSGVEEGFEVVQGFDCVAAAGVAWQVEQACGVWGGGDEVERRVPLVSSEHRGCASPISADGQTKGTVGEVTGAEENIRGTSKRRKRVWVKSRPVGCYAVGVDIEWDRVLMMSQKTLVGRVMGRNFARKTVVDWVDEHWRVLLGYAPEVDMLLRG